MRKIIATFITVTPLFLSGADQTQVELRGTSFKGVLRFWWRALAYSRLKGDLAAIHGEECRVFGNANSGKGIFNLKVSQIDKEKTLNAGQLFKHNNAIVGDGILYLGYGLVNAAAKKGEHEKGSLIRTCALTPLQFNIELLFKGEADAFVIDALKILGLLGGLGSRSRRGFGSLTLEKMEGDIQWQAPVDIKTYQENITELLKSAGSLLPAYTAFSKDSRITVLNEGNDAMSLLEHIGSKMQLYRSWRKGEENFRPDHDLGYDVSRGLSPSTHPSRVVFGLPHNYYLTHIAPPNNKFDVSPSQHTRRASPFMIHIHKFGEENYAGLGMILPSVFLPGNEQIEIKNSDQRIKVKNGSMIQNIDFKVLHKFVDGFEGPHGAKTSNAYFPNRKDIYPKEMADR